MSDSDIGKTFPFAQTTRTSVMPAASIASNTGGSSREDGVGRNWLSMITATFVAPARSSENARPATGDSSAVRAASVASPTGRGLVRDRRARAGSASGISSSSSSR